MNTLSGCSPAETYLNRSGHAPVVRGVLFSFMRAAAACTAIFLCLHSWPTGASSAEECLAEISPKIQAAYANVQKRHDASPQFAAFEQHIVLLVHLAEGLHKTVRGFVTGNVEDMLIGVDPFGDNSPESRKRSIPDPVAMYQPLRIQLSEFPALDEFPEDDRAALRSYHHAAVHAVTQWISDQARAMATTDPAEKQACRDCCLLLPFAAIPDSEWSLQDTLKLPNWIVGKTLLASMAQDIALDGMVDATPAPARAGQRDPEKSLTRRARHFEEFALSLERTRTAYSFSLLSSREPPGDSSFISYIEATVERLSGESRFRQAAACLTGGIEFCISRGNKDAAARLLLERSRILADLQSLNAAGEDAASILKDYRNTPAAPGAVRLAIRCLFEAGEFEKVIELGRELRQDERLRDSFPQILYAQWLSCIRLYDNERAKPFQKKFLEKYSSHDLAAEMYYLLLCRAVARAEFHEADRYATIIETNYPGSRVMKPVSQIRRRMEKEGFPKPDTQNIKDDK